MFRVTRRLGWHVCDQGRRWRDPYRRGPELLAQRDIAANSVPNRIPGTETSKFGASRHYENGRAGHTEATPGYTLTCANPSTLGCAYTVRAHT